MATLIEQLDAMRELAENWDGYGAASPQTHAVDLAQELVGLLEAVLQKSSADPTLLYVNPTRIGGILIDWEDHLRQHEIEINPDRSISFLHVDKGTGQIETQRGSA
jgi:hypothetical protein